MNKSVDLGPGYYFNLNVDMRPQRYLIVNVKGIFNRETGLINWTFRCLDPNKLETPEDPMEGFLPPITKNGHEIGWMSFSVDHNQSLPTGTQIKNRAFVNFDGIGPYCTAPPEGPFTNTIDSVPPTSNLTATLLGINRTQLNWIGEDDLNGSGVKDYTIYVSEDGKPYEAWLVQTTNTSAIFYRETGHSYNFYSIARDNVGNIEKVSGEPEIEPQYHECDLNYDGIHVRDYNDLMTAYKCFLGIGNNCSNNYQNWNSMKQEYDCFTGNYN